MYLAGAGRWHWRSLLVVAQGIFDLPCSMQDFLLQHFGVWWLRLYVSSAGDPGLISGQGTRYHVLQPKVLQAAFYFSFCSNLFG